MSRRPILGCLLLLLFLPSQEIRAQDLLRFVRFELNGGERWGLLKGDRVSLLRGDPFGEHHVMPTDMPLSDLTLLPPVNPSKVIAVGLNYQSHLGERAPAAYPG